MRNIRRLQEMSRPVGSKNIPLQKYGFVRAPEEDFTDDGARFTAYWYDPEGRGDKTFRLTKTTYDGEVFISVRYSLPGTRTSKYIDNLNGVSVDEAIEGLPDLVKQIEDARAKISTFTAKTLTAKEIETISDEVAKAATRLTKYKVTTEVLKAHGIDKDDLDNNTIADLEASIDEKVGAKLAAATSKDTLKALAKEVLKKVMYQVITKYQKIDDALKYIYASVKDENGNYISFSDLDKATQNRMREWVKSKIEADDFE